MLALHDTWTPQKEGIAGGDANDLNDVLVEEGSRTPTEKKMLEGTEIQTIPYESP